MPFSTTTPKVMSRCKFAKAMTYFEPLRGGVTAAASFTIACNCSADSIAPSKLAGSKPWKSSANAAPANISASAVAPAASLSFVIGSSLKTIGS